MHPPGEARYSEACSPGWRAVGSVAVARGLGWSKPGVSVNVAASILLPDPQSLQAHCVAGGNRAGGSDETWDLVLQWYGYFCWGLW